MPKSEPSVSKSFKRYMFEFLILCFVVGAVFVFQQRNMLPSDGSVKLPDSQFVTLSGRTLTLLADDKPTLVYIFAPWCSICRISINNLDSLHPDKVNVVRIGVDFNILKS